MKVADNLDRHKISDEFKFQQDRTIHWTYSTSWKLGHIGLFTLELRALDCGHVGSQVSDRCRFRHPHPFILHTALHTIYFTDNHIITLCFSTDLNFFKTSISISMTFCSQIDSNYQQPNDFLALDKSS